MLRARIGLVATASLAACLIGCGGIQAQFGVGAAQRTSVETPRGGDIGNGSSSNRSSGGKSASDADATTACLALDAPKLLPMPDGTKLAAAFTTTGAGVEEWRAQLVKATGISEPGSAPNPAPPSSAATAFICYFDGDFGRPRGDPADDVPDYNRVIVTDVVDGGLDVAAMGYADGLPIIAPPAK